MPFLLFNRFDRNQILNTFRLLYLEKQKNKPSRKLILEGLF